ncbi:MAG: hypothetical protein K0S47_2312 [Herbinix sp.]|nr:hypothetical protein [Herbinix sp.]
MAKTLAIYDSDINYATLLMECFNRRKDLEFNYLVFSKEEYLEEHLKENQIEILLLGEPLTLDEKKKDRVKQVMRLAEKDGIENSEGTPYIFKYQSGKDILKSVVTYYEGQDQVVSNNAFTIDTGIITIVSPICGRSQVEFGWSLGHILCETQRTLLIPLELFPAQLMSSNQLQDQSLSEFIYFLKQSNPNLMMKMKSLLHFIGNLSYLSGVTHGLDILSLTREDIALWLDELRLHTDYQQVIFLINYFGDSVLELMNKSDRICIPIMDDPFDAEVWKEWKRQMMISGYDFQKEHIQMLQLPKREEGRKISASLQELKLSSSWRLAMEYANSIFR